MDQEECYEQCAEDYTSRNMREECYDHCLHPESEEEE